ncbi:MAG: ABC transporter ATP-binding protein [Phycisphaerales bacterium]|nr:ABC transporter ATP-binding protein [Phycisphaerales bacterium]
MGPFLSFARRLLRSPGQLALTLVFAAISASGLGAGLLALGPILRLLLGESGSTLPDLAATFNATKPWVLIPDALIQTLPVGRMDGVWVILTGLAALTILGAIANFLHQYISISLCTAVVARIRLDAFRHAIRMPLNEVVRRGPAEFTSRIIRDSAELQSGLVALTSRTVAQLSKGAAALVVAVIFDWRIVVVAAIVGPILAIVLRKTGKRIRRGLRGALRNQEVLLRVAGESLQGLRAVKTATAESDMILRFTQANRLVVREELRARTARSLAGPLVETIAILAVIALCALVVREIIRGAMTFEDFVLSLGALAVAGGSVRPMTGLVGDMQAASAPAQRLQEILSLDTEPRRTRGQLTLLRHQHTIRFEDVTFTYPTSTEPTLRSITLDIRHGEHIAIVGPNGCGKTTLLAILPRILVPQSGRVLIDGCDLASVSLKSLRRQIGVVTQESMLIRGTICENIAMGSASLHPAGISRELIRAAAARAHASGFIEALPDGYDTQVSEQGASLSGGQRQRIAIARAVLRDPSILILDEATSQIDAESEVQINGAIEEFGRQRTVIVVAHRLSTMLAADRIVVMDQGCVIDSGTHAQLLARCDIYARLVRAQMLDGATISIQV